MWFIQWSTIVLQLFSALETYPSLGFRGQVKERVQSEAEAPPLWFVVVAGGSSEAFRQQTGDVIRAHLSGHSLQVETLSMESSVDLSTVLDSSRLPTQANRAKIVWWVDFSQDNRIRTYLLEADSGKIYRRDLASNARHPTIINEVLGNIAGTTASAWLRDHRISEMQVVTKQEIHSAQKELAKRKQIDEKLVSSPLAEDSESDSAPIDSMIPKAPPSVASDKAKAVASERWWELAGVAAYYGSTFSTNIPWQQGVAIGFAWRPLYRLNIHLLYIGVVPSRVENEWLTLRLHRYPAWLSGEFCQPIHRNWMAQFGGFVSLDYVFREVRRSEASIPVNSNQGRLFVGLGPRVGAKLWTKWHFGMGIFLGMEAVIRRSRYVVRVPDDQVVVVPLPIRGFLQLELSFAGLERRNFRNSSTNFVPN